MGKKATELKRRFESATLYAITCSPDIAQGQTYEQMVESACEAGVDILQFRDKQLSVKARYETALALADICYSSKVLFIMNDNLDLALAAGADGVHLGQDDLPLSAARSLVDQLATGEFLIGRSTHSLEQALKAEEEGADYIGIGPVFATPTKPTYEPIGLDLVRQVVEQVKVPHVAIGGIDHSNIQQVLSAGAQRVAVVRALCGAKDIPEAVKEMKAKFAAVTPA